jgi:3-hydroxybutyryl-CoA dehydrogenase
VTVERVGVVGCGLMGGGIAQVAAQAGLPTTVVEASPALLERGLGGVRRSLDGLVERGRLDAAGRDAAWGRLRGTTALEDLADADLVIEAITENAALKRETFERLDRVCAPAALLATNTSSCTVTELAAATRRPGQVLGLHFFNPAPVMKLVEVVRTIVTDEATVQAGWAFVKAVGKTPVAAQDTTGFIVNRLLVPYLLDAVRVLEAGIASREDIDQAMKLGCGYPMGPFTLLDLVGLDTTLYVAEVMFQEFREPRYAPPPLLRRMVLAGQLGRKSGQGFYAHRPPGERAPERGA